MKYVRPQLVGAAHGLLKGFATLQPERAVTLQLEEVATLQFREVMTLEGIATQQL